MATKISSMRASLAVITLMLLHTGFAVAEAPAAPASAMTNDDVVKMVKLGFGKDVVVAKINAAPAVNFKLEVDDLQALKGAGVSQDIMAAMLKRSSEPPPAGAYPSGPGVGPATYGYPVPGQGSMVRLSTKDGGELELHSIGGSMSTTFAYVTSLVYVNFPGLKADARVHDTHPTLVLRYRESPIGHFYLVSADVDKRNNVRSVKQGNRGVFSHKNLGAPDSDNQIDYDATEQAPGIWRLTPKRELQPGEYGLWMSMAQFYDFGVDP